MDFLRNIQDLYSNPAQYVEMVVDRLKNFNRGEKAVINDQGAGVVPMTLEERAQQVTQGALDNLGGAGSGTLGVIKNKGGNWLSGKYGPAEQLRQLRKYGDPEEIAKFEALLQVPENTMTPFVGVATPEARARWQHDLTMLRQGQALNQFVEGPLTKYIKNDMAAPTDPIRLLADAWPAEKAKKLAEAEARVAALRKKQEAQAVTRGVPEEYLTRTRQDVLAAEEARDIIEANTGLHIPEQANRAGDESYLMGKRAGLGFPFSGMAETPLGRQWEMQADAEFNPRPAKDFLLTENLKADPWLAKVNPNTPINTMRYGAGDFKHITDELYNSLREGRLTPEQVARMPVDQAVRHVAEINALRAVKARQEQALESANIPLYKDYPEQGISWRQLKSDDKDQLQKWLTQEGDAMGHCVGGYCEDVAEGASSIYSLRDAKGKPHVTIETVPGDIEGTFNIAQVKGLNNRAPDPKYHPFIQDFIKSGKWGEVNDLHHTGMDIPQLDPYLVSKD